MYARQLRAKSRDIISRVRLEGANVATVLIQGMEKNFFRRKARLKLATGADGRGLLLSLAIEVEGTDQLLEIIRRCVGERVNGSRL